MASKPNISFFRLWIERVVESIVRWRVKHVSDQAFLFILAVGTGLICGAFAALLKAIIHHLAVYFKVGLHMDGPNYTLLLIPLVGIVLTGIYQRYILRHNIEHGVRRLQNSIAANHYMLPPYLMWAPMIASSLTLGFGGSAGSEGPIATTGAAVGSNVARLFRLDKRMILIMVGCGAGAGIAGIFKAPIGGMLFTLEVMRIELTTVSVMALLMSCITAAMTAYVLSGYTVDLSYLQMEQFDASVIPWVILLGVATGFYSLYYSDVMDRMGVLFSKIHNPWYRNIISGVILSVILFVFPAMYGEGYDMMGHLLNGDFSALTSNSPFFEVTTASWQFLLIVGGIALSKCFAASSSNSGGGVAGDFAPTLFAGCMVGFFFASALNEFCGLDLPVSGFAFMGMAGVMSGAIRAPLMALFLTVEMTDGFILFLPLLVVSAVSFGIVRIFRPARYYKNFS